MDMEWNFGSSMSDISSQGDCLLDIHLMSSFSFPAISLVFNLIIPDGKVMSWNDFGVPRQVDNLQKHVQACGLSKGIDLVIVSPLLR